jgi:hypothetical protein
VQHVLADYSPRKKDWRWVFLEALAKTCCVSSACVAANVPRKTAYAHREKFPKFRRAWDEALEIGVEALEVYARHRAFNPADPASHILTMFLLKAHKPHKYRDNGHQIPKDEPEDEAERLTPDALARLSQDDLDALESIAKKLAGQADGGPQADPS